MFTMASIRSPHSPHPEGSHGTYPSASMPAGGAYAPASAAGGVSTAADDSLLTTVACATRWQMRVNALSLGSSGAL